MDDDDNMPPAGPKQLPVESGRPNAEPPTGSTATNGHWRHDDSGPVSYVGSPSPSLSRLNDILVAKAPGLRCVRDGDTLYIDGLVENDTQAHDILQMVAELEPDITVTSRLMVRKAGG